MNQPLSLTQQQAASLLLMRNDLRFLYTLVRHYQEIESNYSVFSMPYIGLIIDGVEDWIKAYNNSHTVKFNVPTFSVQEREFYEKMRSCIKLWDNSYETVYEEVKRLYLLSDHYFSGICKPIAKRLKIYDIFGADLADGCYCGNTILCSYYVPEFDFHHSKGEEIKKLSVIAGKYTSLFQATTPYRVNPQISFTYANYGGFVKSPVGNAFSDRFVLFSLLCQINYIVKCIDEYILDETTTKLRFSYILYYYILRILPEINAKLSTQFVMDNKWHSDAFRNSMAHYKLGVALKDSELILSDPLYGLTQKFLGCDYNTLKNGVMQELSSLASQLKVFLKL